MTPISTEFHRPPAFLRRIGDRARGVDAAKSAGCESPRRHVDVGLEGLEMLEHVEMRQRRGAGNRHVLRCEVRQHG